MTGQLNVLNNYFPDYPGLIIAVLTMGYRSYAAVRLNVVDVLKDE